MVKIHLFGPRFEEVNSFVMSIPEKGDSIVWADFPEVHVKCASQSLMHAICERFGKTVYSIEGLSFSQVVGGLFISRHLTLATAESCTGGLIGDIVTSSPGSSFYYLGGIVAYSNRAKINLLGVAEDVIQTFGAVSKETAEAMALGVRDKFGSDIGVSVTGIAGPQGGTKEKPVGTVWFALSHPKGVYSCVKHFEGNRNQIKRVSAFTALDMARIVCLEEMI